MVSYDVLGPGGRVILHAQTPVGVGKLTQSGAEVKFGDKNSWIDLQTDTGVQRVPARVNGKTVGLSMQKTDAWIIPLKACGSSEKPVTLQQTGRERDSWDNHSAREDSRAVAMLKTCKTGLERLAHRCGSRRLRCGLDSSMQMQDDSSETRCVMACRPCQRACRGSRTRRTPSAASSRRTVS